jgi:S-adenosylmethionine/arginine decarboxylase-like enzyme
VQRGENPLELSVKEYALNRFFKPPSQRGEVRDDFQTSTALYFSFFQALTTTPLESGTKVPEGVTQTTYYYDCADQKAMMLAHRRKNKSTLDRILRTVLKKHGSKKYKSWMEGYKGTESHGYTYSAFIGKSAVTIHTWPEHGTVTVDINVCDLETDEADIDVMIDEMVAEFDTFYAAGTVDNHPRTRAPLISPSKR